MPWTPQGWKDPTVEECDFEQCRTGRVPCSRHPMPGWTPELQDEGWAPTAIERLVHRG